MPPAPLLAVDAPYLMYRSFFAMPESITGVDDRPVGALLGAVNLLLRAAADRRPRAVVVCFGAEAAKYRTALYDGYHADRPPVPDALQWQFDRAPALMSAFGWTTLDTDTLEADDLLGALGVAEAAAGGRAELMTGDRDMFQCATDRVSVLLLKPGKGGFEPVDPAGVRDRYGIDPGQVPDFIALRGDPSDGIPGAPGIGATTAAEILGRHGSLDAAIAAVGTDAAPKPGSGERPRIAAIIRDNAPSLRDYREMATLQPVDVTLPADRETNLTTGADAAESLGLGALARRLRAADTVNDL